MSLTWKWRHRSAVGRSSSPLCHLERGQRTGLQAFISFSRSSRGALQQEWVQKGLCPFWWQGENFWRAVGRTWHRSQALGESRAWSFVLRYWQKPWDGARILASSLSISFPFFKISFPLFLFFFFLFLCAMFILSWGDYSSFTVIHARQPRKPCLRELRGKGDPLMNHWMVKGLRNKGWRQTLPQWKIFAWCQDVY